MLSCQIVQAIDSMFHVSELVVATGWETKWFVGNCHGRTIQNALGDFANFPEFTTCSNLTASCFSHRGCENSAN